MKRSILALTLAAAMLGAGPALYARDRDNDRDNDVQSDVHSLWEWYGHLRSESDARGNRHTRDELDGVRGNLKHIEDALHDGHHGDRVRGEIEGVRDELRQVNEELHWHGEVQHRPGFNIIIR